MIVGDGRVVGRGWTADGGRPHAEALALAQAGEKSRGATLYVTLEPCAHVSTRGPACADLVADSGVARVVVGCVDPDPRTSGAGIARIRAAGIDVATAGVEAAALAGFLMRQRLGRPHVTLKLALSIDGRIAMPDGTSRWITGERARAHAHLERARVDAILVGRGTLEADRPRLDVRIEGLEDRAPRRLLLSGCDEPGWERIGAPGAIAALAGVDRLLVEGGARTAAAFLAADLVDRLLVYRAPVLLGDGMASLGGLGLDDLGAAHGRWTHAGSIALAPDRLEMFDRVR